MVKITDFASVQHKSASAEVRVARYRRQAEARRLKPDHRVAWCCRKVAADPESHRLPEELPIRRSEASGNLYLGGMYSCQRAIVCPVCGARRAGAFLDRLLTALRGNLGRFTYGMDTLTASSAGMLADEFTRRYRAALRRFNSGRAAAAFKARWHIRGYVTGLDFTQGDHGPHFHAHRMIVMDRRPFSVERPSQRALNANPVLAARWAAFDWRVTSISVMGKIDDTIAALMHAEAAPRWIECCAAEGLIADLDHGYHIEGGDRNAAHYVGKLAMEVTQAGNKRGRGGRTLGELLDASAAGDRQAGQMWRDAVEAMSGMPILRASNGLWELLGEAEPTEDQIAAGDESTLDRLIALMPRSDWNDRVLAVDRFVEFHAALAENSLSRLILFARLAGVRLLPSDPGSALEAAQGQPGRIVRIDLDALISWTSGPEVTRNEARK